MLLPTRLLIILAIIAVQPPVSLTLSERTIIDAALAHDEIRVSQRAPQTDEARLSAAAAYADKVLGQRISTSSVDRLWAVEPALRDGQAELETARAEGRLAAWLAALPPTSVDYRRLQGAYRYYDDIVLAGGWEPLPSGPSIKPGDRAALVSLLRLGWPGKVSRFSRHAQRRHTL